ncbi:MAG: gliding motility-associated C-terminal domain-containing protein [Crocinitomicaceae bacterium]|nr:gliding motility-associated C-terminal domain-containing protein [Crocinitomicaceae bacterium]
MRKVLFLLLLITTEFSLASNENPPAICPTLQMTGTDVECYGSTNGTATVVVSNGSGDYTITWSNGVPPTNFWTSTIQGLGVGTYTVNVLDNWSGCTAVGAFIVGSPDPISTAEIITDVLCFGDNTGEVNVTTTGGTSAYNFSWTGGSTLESLTNATAGTYTLNVSDAFGCTYSETYTINEPLEAIAGSAIISDALCFGTGTGTIDLNVWGGTPSYAYLWTSTDLTQDVTGLTTGNYSVTITDFNDCQLTLNYFIDQPAAITSIVGYTEVLCYGDATGSAMIDPSGGTTPYSYSWQNSVNLFSEDNDTIYNIPADTYQVVLTDYNGCTDTGTVVVAQPAPLLLSNTFVNVLCYGGDNGSIDLTVTGGSPTYSYSWTNSVGDVIGATQDIGTLVAETYTVEVTDNNGCLAYMSQEVTQPPLPISTTYESVDVLCYGENTGSIDLTASGGTPPYSYSWTSGQATEDIANLLAGTYGYTVIDNNLCVDVGSVDIIQPNAPLDATFIVTDANCFGESNGIIDMTVTGGTLDYTYSWINSTYSLSIATEDLVNFVADSYTYEIVDGNNCLLGGTIDINEPDELIPTLAPTHILCYGEATGELNLTVAGGTVPYGYVWSSGPVTEDIVGLIAGYYEVTITDDHNCQATIGETLTQPTDTISYTFDVFNVSCNAGSNGAIDLFTAGGTPGYNYLWSTGEIVSDIEDLTAGYHVFQITDANNCFFSDSIYVDQPDPLLLNEVITPVSCYGGDDGLIDISPTGGTAPFTFSWYNSVFALAVQTEDLTGVADVYQIEVIDSNGCFYEAFIDLPQPDSITIDYTIKQVTCYGWSDGAIYVDISGGNPGYITEWSDGSFDVDLIDVVSDTFQLIVTDTKGCMDTLTEFVPQPDSLILDFDITPASCIDALDGIALTLATGGNGGYMYDWSNETIEEALVGGTGTYTLIVTDILGCTADAEVFIPYLELPCIDPPNAFTPNDDVYNDTWRIDNINFYPDVEVIIFNKWGNKVHKQSGTYEPWDGKINGIDAPSATYYWVIHPNYEDRSSFTGNVTIIR